MRPKNRLARSLKYGERADLQILLPAFKPDLCSSKQDFYEPGVCTATVKIGVPNGERMLFVTYSGVTPIDMLCPHGLKDKSLRWLDNVSIDGEMAVAVAKTMSVVGVAVFHDLAADPRWSSRETIYWQVHCTALFSRKPFRNI